MLTQSHLKSMLRYDADTGEFHWIAGRRAGQLSGTYVAGRRRIGIGAKTYPATHLAFLYQTGQLPAPGQMVDHIDRDRTNDSWSNLRLSTPAQNTINSAPRNGYKGVFPSPTANKWKASIRVDYRDLYLGTFDSAEAAARAYDAAALKHFGAFAYLNRV